MTRRSAFLSFALACIFGAAGCLAGKRLPLPSRLNIWDVEKRPDEPESGYIAQFAMEGATETPTTLVVRCNGYTRQFGVILLHVDQKFDKALYKLDDGKAFMGLYVYFDARRQTLSFDVPDAMPNIFGAKRIEIHITSFNGKHLDLQFQIPLGFMSEKDEVLRHCNPPNRE